MLQHTYGTDHFMLHVFWYINSLLLLLPLDSKCRRIKKGRLEERKWKHVHGKRKEQIITQQTAKTGKDRDFHVFMQTNTLEWAEIHNTHMYRCVSTGQTSCSYVTICWTLVWNKAWSPHHQISGLLSCTELHPSGPWKQTLEILELNWTEVCFTSHTGLMSKSDVNIITAITHIS